MPRKDPVFIAKEVDLNRAKAVGHIPSGLFIVCAGDTNKNSTNGYLASWVQQVSFSPLRIALAVKPGRPAFDLIMAGTVFTINIIGTHNDAYMKHFWQGYNPDDNPFDKLDLKQGEFGGILLTAAKSSIECKLHSSTKPGDHVLVIADVLNSYVHNDDAKPLVHVRGTGLDY